LTDKRAKVLVLYTGGTIGMKNADSSNPASPLKPIPDANELIDGIQQLARIKSTLVDFQIAKLTDEGGNEMEPLDSSDINAEHWAAMARAINANYDDWDGFVLLHGTDTMAYTASALSFMLNNLAKPVVVTGSQLSLSDNRTDGVQNLVNSLYIAGGRATGLPLVPEVTVCFADRLLRGNRVRKLSTSSWQGFGTPNFPPIGEIGEHIRIYPDRVRPPADNENDEPFFIRETMDPRVLDFGLFPGLNPLALRQVLELEEVQGMVLRTFGAGNAPNDKEFLDIVGAAVAAGKVIVNVTQCSEGQVEAGLYEASSGLLERGVISGLDMTPEAALTKLMAQLGYEKDREVVKLAMQVDLRGEQTESLFQVKYPKHSSTKGDGESGRVTSGGAPGPNFDKKRLSRAMLSAIGIKADGRAKGTVRIFLNSTAVDQSTGDKDPGYAGTFDLEQPLYCDVTTAFRRVVTVGQNVNITLVASDGSPLSYDSMSLALFTR
jgi:L-asparaginase